MEFLRTRIPYTKKVFTSWAMAVLKPLLNTTPNDDDDGFKKSSRLEKNIVFEKRVDYSIHS